MAYSRANFYVLNNSAAHVFKDEFAIVMGKFVVAASCKYYSTNKYLKFLER
jgi:hypothetical protein